MSCLTTQKGIIHYEVFGRGKPVILLHGWLGSWGLWQETMAFLGDEFRTYALDFWGFGESGKKLNSYEIEDFVGLVDEFMESLGIASAPIVGHSMGGTVSLALARKHPHRARNVTVIGSPIDGRSLLFLLKLAGYRPIARLVHNTMWALKLGIRIGAPIVTRDRRWYGMIDKDLSKTTVESFLTSIASLRRTNLTDEIESIDVPIMGIYGALDVLVNPNQWKPIQEHARHPRIERFKNAGHFPMLDQAERFQHTLREFLRSDGGPNGEATRR
ncbi:MAG TPA: alpha/beta hydrolase [Anaerolineales bacterium]|nr:alpha/beta hydrolase [Anaerolineales bacterium]